MSSSGQRVARPSAACRARAAFCSRSAAHWAWMRASAAAPRLSPAAAGDQVRGGACQHLHGGADVAGGLAEPAIALGGGVEIAGDVVQRQHETAEGRFRRVLPAIEHRCQTHPQQAPAVGGGDELRGGLRRTALQPLLHALQRMLDLGLLEHAIDGAADAHHVGAIGQRGCAGQRAQLQPGARVVEQDAPFEVADHHALGRLRQQRGETVALARVALARATCASRSASATWRCASKALQASARASSAGSLWPAAAVPGWPASRVPARPVAPAAARGAPTGRAGPEKSVRPPTASPAAARASAAPAAP
ncbi:MAG: hypothetical protein R3E70_01315 [Burkholderiaceae bacterium]